MAQATLVEMQIQHAQRLIDRLIQEGIGVTAACWARETDSGDWILYIATPLIPKEGSMRTAYRRVNEVIRKMQEEGFWIETDQLKLVGSSDPIARDLVDHLKNRSPKTPSWFRGYKLGDLAVEEAYVYPPLLSSGEKEKANSNLLIGKTEALQP